MNSTGMREFYCLYLGSMKKIQSLSRAILLFCLLLLNDAYGESLENLDNLVEKLSPSVVRIETASKEKNLNITGDPFFDEFFKRQFGNQSGRKLRPGVGSGFVYGKDGFIVTNFHVVKNADDISIVLHNEKKYEARIIGTDARTDLALLKIDTQDSINEVRIGNSDSLRIGEWVIAIGNPLGLGTTVTTGIISAKSRYVDELGSYVDFIQTDAALNKGNSGGPLFNLSGEIVGVNTAIAARGQGIGFAIPINIAIGVIEELKTNGKVQRGWLGVLIQPISHELANLLELKSTDGALVSEVVADGPAFKAGLKRGDIILSINKMKIKKMEDLPRNVGKLKPKMLAKLEVLRDGKTIDISVRLGTLPITEVSKKQSTESDSLARKKFGFEVKELRIDSDSTDKKVVVVKTYQTMDPPNALLKGDIILEINRQPVEDIEQFNSIVSNIRPNQNCLFVIQRQFQNNLVTLYKSIRSTN